LITEKCMRIFSLILLSSVASLNTWSKYNLT
jgi:hypothetical protein